MNLVKRTISLEKKEEDFKKENRFLENRNSIVKQHPSIGNECFYVVDLILEKITAHAGCNSLLGIRDVDMNIGNLKKAIHPDDYYYALRIYNNILSQNIYSKNEIDANLLNICYRFKGCRNRYIYILNQVFIDDVSIEGKITSLKIKCLDVSFIGSSDDIAWETNFPNSELNQLKRETKSELLSLFTSRELDIIREILKGKTNQQISTDLHISYHTVTTHRKHIFKKVNCHSPSELIMHFHKKGIIV